MTTIPNNSDKPLVVIAIGGNSLITDSAHMSVVDQYRAAGETAANIAPIVSGERNIAPGSARKLRG
jgi:carbamate kinase